MTALPDTMLRHGDLNSLVDMLRAQTDVKYDVVVNAAGLRYKDGALVVTDPNQATLSEDGVTAGEVRLDPTDLFEDGIADRLGIPRQYLRRLRETSVPVTVGAYPHDLDVRLLDANVNGWLQREPGRRFLVRGFHADGMDGIARAFLSDRFNPIDHLDALLAVLQGVRESGAEIEVYSADLSERSMRVTVTSPQAVAMAPIWLGNYRSPFDGRFDEEGRSPGATGNRLGAPGHEYRPIVHGGFDFRNSETGGGALQIAPWMLVEVCKNGLTRPVDALRKVHLGSRLDEGKIVWAEDTRRKNLDLIMAEARDAVRTFLDPTYVARWVDEIEQASGKPVDDPVATIERVSASVGFTEGEQASILDCFIKSGDLTAGGVLNAVTAAAQGVDSPDRQAEMEDRALDVLHAV